MEDIEEIMDKALRGVKMTADNLKGCLAIPISMVDKNKVSNWEIIKIVVAILKWQEGE